MATDQSLVSESGGAPFGADLHLFGRSLIFSRPVARLTRRVHMRVFSAAVRGVFSIATTSSL
jgi:hypothetical protein